jgi:hypothetical protein
VTELEHFKVWSGRPEPAVGIHTAVDLAAVARAPEGPQTSFPQDRQWCRRTVTPLKARSQTIQVAELPSAIHSGDDASRGGDSSASLAATASAATSARSAMPMASFMLVGRSCPEL